MSENDVIDDWRWKALRDRDAAADSSFLYAVVTTGVYCRPSCGARLPKPHNVEFYPSNREAERRGYRPCKRCKPDRPPLNQLGSERAARLCRFIAAQPEAPKLEALARHVGLSPSHTHRLFKAATGLTPKQYAAEVRGARLRANLRNGSGVTRAIYDAGYNSTSRVYERSRRLLGMNPKEYERGAADLEVRYATGRSSLGRVLVAATTRGLCAILLGESDGALRADLEQRFPKAKLSRAGTSFRRQLRDVVRLIEDPGGTLLSLPLDLQGTVFQHRVWKALSEIPPGTTVSYAQLAAIVGKPSATRAVARACATNPLAVAVPCHRVVRSDGSLAGYRWGLDRKRKLLERER